MKLNVLKYIGVFSGSEAKGVIFPRGIPVVVGDTALYESLVAQPDFVATTLEDQPDTVVVSEPVVFTAVTDEPVPTPTEV